MTALVLGDAVWAGLALALALWVVVSALCGPKRLPGFVDVARWWCDSWLGRLLALAGWAAAGWHVFCQRP